MTRTDAWSERWLALAEQWQRQAADAGLLDLMNAIQEGVRPLAPLAAQLLWVTQPTFSLFGEADAIGALATLLDDPAHRDGETAQPRSQPESR